MTQKIQITPPEPTKDTYRVTNWRDYNRALVQRGSLTLWIDADVLKGWRAPAGKGKRYSDLAIQSLLCLRAAFKLPLRQAQGFMESLKTLMQLTIKVPHYTKGASFWLTYPLRPPRPGLDPGSLGISIVILKCIRKSGPGSSPGRGQYSLWDDKITITLGMRRGVKVAQPPPRHRQAAPWAGDWVGSVYRSEGLRTRFP